jgi:hypothetical protein
MISRRYLPCGWKRRNWTIPAPCFRIVSSIIYI